MRCYEFIKSEFIRVHKKIDNIEYLDKYINILLNYSNNNLEEYTEKHHILPRSIFPEYSKEDWNIIEINYEDHKLVHLCIFKAINIRSYQRPLNWMMNYYKNKEEISNAAKRGWLNLKSNEGKYKKWRNNKSLNMKTLSKEEQKRRANIFWKNITQEEYLIFCNKIRKTWTKKKREEKSKQMKEFYSNPENIQKKSKESKYRWDKMDSDSRLMFSEKMKLINQDINKRLDAGEKIKELWKTPKYIEKMKTRKSNPGIKLKLIKTDGGVIIFDKMVDFTKKYNFSSYLIRKYRDSNNKIQACDIKDDSRTDLLDCIIETLIKL